jgi:regulatory protein
MSLIRNPAGQTAARDADACRECALRLLDRRAHSEHELRTKLRQRQFPAVLIEELLRDFRRLKLVDDLAFARLLIEQKRHGAGRMKLIQELRKRGVPQELFPQLETEFFTGADAQEDEISRAAELLSRKLGGARRTEQPAPRKAGGDAMQAKLEARKQELSLLRFLAARGFSMSAARQAVAQALGKN